MSIYLKLMCIQEELKAPKNQFNSFGKYNYRSCEDILEGLKPVLSKYMCAVTVSDEVAQIGDRYYIRATVTLFDSETGENTFTTALAREENEKKGMDSSQLTGSTSSYARKYALNGMFAIDDTKDSDSTNKHDKGKETAKNEVVEEKKPQADVISDAQAKRLFALAKGNLEGAKRIMLEYGYTSSKDIKKKNYEEIAKKIEELGEVSNVN